MSRLGRLRGAMLWGFRREASSSVGMLLLIVLVVFSILRNSNFLTQDGMAGLLPEAAPLLLATMAVAAVAQAGPASIDLSIGPLMVLVNVVIVQWLVPAGLNNPVILIVLAMLIGIVFNVIMCVIISTVRIQPVIVTLSGFMVLTGLDLVIMPQQGGSVPTWLAAWGYPTGAVSPALWVLVIAILVWGVLSRTTVMRNIRLAGTNARTAYVNGIPLFWARVGAHIVGGLYAGLAGLMLTALLASGDPTQGAPYTLYAVAALVLGGASLKGGRVSVFGAVIGALDIYLIGFVLQTYNFGANSGFVTELITGLVLVVALAGSGLIQFFHTRRSRGISMSREGGDYKVA